MEKGRLLVVSGPSGAGKGSISKRIVAEVQDLVYSVSMTTRAPRLGEIHGKNYYFVTHEEFEQTISSGGFLEYAKVYGEYYGTPKEQVMEILKAGKDVVLEIDIQGAMNIRKAYPKGVLIFILPPSMTELRKRITGRGSESEGDIELRLGEALKEIAYIDKYDYCVVNGDLDEAVNRVKAIIIAEHSRVEEDIYELIREYKEEE
jgi:guanylate kinase